ncbi:solute carrier family 35 member F2-like [Brevipalpus obovatus]|uniref:solute carrier family 35 member F2-like n=1 Tax=Brevipalpus obovatus TaxID=246614 RepID=UPI003D9E20DB
MPRNTLEKVWKTVLLGQSLSILLTGTGITSQLLQDNYKFTAPTAQSFLNYLLLCLIFTTWLAFKPSDRSLITVLRQRGWKYLILAIIDVEANFLVVKAYQYTTLTSIQLLDCFTIPTVLSLSWLCIGVRYGIIHIIGVCFSLIGIGCLVYADLDESTKQIEAKDRFLGDMLCILGATLYGMSNVAQEYVIKSFSIVEFLGMIGLFGTIVNGVQLVIMERDQIKILFQLEKIEEMCLIFGFAACLLLLYITMPLVLQVSSATSVNLSVLSADFYALVIGLFLFNFKFSWLYFLSFGLIIFGVTIFNLVPAPSSIDLNDESPSTSPSVRSRRQSATAGPMDDPKCNRYTSLDPESDSNRLTISNNVNSDVTPSVTFISSSSSAASSFPFNEIPGQTSGTKIGSNFLNQRIHSKSANTTIKPIQDVIAQSDLIISNRLPLKSLSKSSSLSRTFIADHFPERTQEIKGIWQEQC